MYIEFRFSLGIRMQFIVIQKQYIYPHGIFFKLGSKEHEEGTPVLLMNRLSNSFGNMFVGNCEKICKCHD